MTFLNLGTVSSVAGVFDHFAKSSEGEKSDSSPEHYSFKIKEPSNLSLISLRLYGKASRWRDIAKWNNISPPHRVYIGQILRLEEKPTLSNEQGDYVVLQFWRKKMGLISSQEHSELHASALDSQRFASLRDAHAHFENRNLEKAYSEVEKNRKIAMVPSPEVNPELIWIEGSAAETIFQFMTDAKKVRASVNYKNTFKAKLSILEVERKIGRDMICARVPRYNRSKSQYLTTKKGRFLFETKCAGITRISKNAVNSITF